MKKWIAILLTCTLLLSVVGCTKEESGETAPAKTEPAAKTTEKEAEVTPAVEEAPAEPVKFSFWYTALEGDETDVVYKWNKENVDLFMAEHPNVEIETTIIGGNGGGNYRTKLYTEIAAGNVPDFFMTWHGGNTKPMVDQGVLMSLDEVVDNDAEFKSALDYSKLALCTYDGTLYGLPDTVDVIGLFYNKAVFEENGLSVPKTYEDLLSAQEVLDSKKITTIGFGGKAGWQTGLVWQYIFMQLNGYDRYKQDILEKQIDLTDSAYVEAMAKYRALYEAGVFGDNVLSIDPAEAKAKFLSGESAMLLQGSWALASLAAELGDNLGFMTFPSVDGKDPSYMVAASKGYALSKDAPKEAVDFMKFMYSPERQAAYAEMQVFIPTINVPYDQAKLPAVMNDINGQLNESNLTFVIWGDFLGEAFANELWSLIQGILSGEDIEEMFELGNDVAELEFKNQ